MRKKQTCPCSNPDDCHPISSSVSNANTNSTSFHPIRASGEVYGFEGLLNETGQQYNWTHISTVAWAVNDELMCRAHHHGARAVVAAPSFNLELLSEMDDPDRAAYIQTWVRSTLAMVQTRHRDGVVFDYEDPTPRNSPVGHAYVQLIDATRRAFRSPPSVPPLSPLQVTTCVAWSPEGIDGRYFPHGALADASDLLYVMDYDTQSQVTQGACVAGANAPITGTRRGIEQFLELGIAPQKLVLGVPWYGYQYPCVPGSMKDASDRFCPIPLVPFRGIDCSDAAGTQVSYYTLMEQYKSQTPEERSQTGGMRRDDYMEAAFFNSIKDNNDTLVRQSWMDDPRSLRRKYSYARSMGLAGVGPYAFHDLDPVLQPEESRQMWSTFDDFFGGLGDGVSGLVEES